LILWKKEGNKGPMQITTDNDTSSTTSEPNSKDDIILTRFMKTTFINSLDKIQNNNIQDDSLLQDFNIFGEKSSF
jgi:hypothetical protein